MNDSKDVEEGIEVEKIKMSGLTVQDLLDKDFLKNIRDMDIEDMPIFIIFGNLKNNSIITIGHENPTEFKEKIIHVGSVAGSAETVRKLTEILKKIKKLGI